MAAFTVIDHTELTGTTAYWEETGISSSYGHLMLATSLRGDRSGHEWGNTLLTLNGAGGTAYSETRFYAQTATTVSDADSSRANYTSLITSEADALAGAFASTVLWIPHYANTVNYKSILSRSVGPNNSNTDDEWQVRIGAGLYASTAAITEIRIDGNVSDFVQYSTFTLYGVTGA
jgi:hypothetical protein